MIWQGAQSRRDICYLLSTRGENITYTWPPSCLLLLLVSNDKGCVIKSDSFVCRKRREREINESLGFSDWGCEMMWWGNPKRIRRIGGQRGDAESLARVEPKGEKNGLEINRILIKPLFFNIQKQGGCGLLALIHFRFALTANKSY